MEGASQSVDRWRNELSVAGNAMLSCPTGEFAREVVMRKILLSTFMVLFLVTQVSADSSIKEKGKEVGNAFKKAGIETGHALRESGKEVGKDLKEVGKEAGKEGRTVGEWFRDAGKKTGDAFKQSGRDIRKFFSGK